MTAVLTPASPHSCITRGISLMGMAITAKSMRLDLQHGGEGRQAQYMRMPGIYWINCSGKARGLEILHQRPADAGLFLTGPDNGHCLGIKQIIEMALFHRFLSAWWS